VKSPGGTTDLLEAFASSRSGCPWRAARAERIPRSSLPRPGSARWPPAEWIETDATGAKYRLGVRALICGTAYLDRDPAVPYAPKKNAGEHRDRPVFTAHYARLNAPRSSTETRESRRSIHLIPGSGRTLPAVRDRLAGVAAELTTTSVPARTADLPAMTTNT